MIILISSIEYVGSLQTEIMNQEKNSISPFIHACTYGLSVLILIRNLGKQTSLNIDNQSGVHNQFFLDLCIYIYLCLSGETYCFHPICLSIHHKSLYLQLLLFKWEFLKKLCMLAYFHIQSNLSYVTFQGNSEIWSNKTGGRLIQV